MANLQCQLVTQAAFSPPGGGCTAAGVGSCAQNVVTGILAQIHWVDRWRGCPSRYSSLFLQRSPLWWIPFRWLRNCFGPRILPREWTRGRCSLWRRRGLDNWWEDGIQVPGECFCRGNSRIWTLTWSLTFLSGRLTHVPLVLHGDPGRCQATSWWPGGYPAFVWAQPGPSRQPR